MRLKNLLSTLFLSAAAVSAANAEELYIIKDGELAKGWEVLEYADPADGLETTLGVKAPDGSTAAKLTPHAQYNDARFYYKDGLDITKTWRVVFDIYYEDGALDVLTHDGSNWEAVDMSFGPDTVGGNYSWDGAFAKLGFSICHKDSANEWSTEAQDIYINPANLQTPVQLVTFGWQRQIADATTIGPCYIKNMKLVGEGNYPIFAENFENVLGMFYQESQKPLQNYNLNSDGTINVPNADGINDLSNFTTGIPLYCAPEEGTKAKNQNVELWRLYESSATDGSEYFDREVFRSLCMVTSSDRNGLKGFAFYAIPLKGLESATSFNYEFISKWDAQRATKESFDEDTKSELPVYYAYVDDIKDVLTAEPQNLADSTLLINGLWKKYEFNIKAEKKNYLVLIFKTNDTYSYNVDNIRVTAANLTPTKFNLNADNEVISFTAVAQDYVEKVLGEKLAIYPNPATDVITVSNEGVESVVVVNAVGAVVAQSNGNTVNVANLANGIYFVKAYTANGVVAGTIIKK